MEASHEIWLQLASEAKMFENDDDGKWAFGSGELKTTMMCETFNFNVSVHSTEGITSINLGSIIPFLKYQDWHVRKIHVMPYTTTIWHNWLLLQIYTIIKLFTKTRLKDKHYTCVKIWGYCDFLYFKKSAKKKRLLITCDLSQLMRLWYLSHRRPAKALQSHRCSHTWSMGVDEGSDQKSAI